MRTIESKEDFVQWADEVNRGLTTKQKPDYQDYYAHSDQKDLGRWFVELNGKRNLILHSVLNTMAYEECERLMLAWAKHKAQGIIDQEAEELNNTHSKKMGELEAWKDDLRKFSDNLERRKGIFEESKKPIHKRIETLRKTARDLKEENEALVTRNQYLEHRTKEAMQEAAAWARKAAQLDALRLHLATLLDLGTTGRIDE
jgi:hypothetical protein